MDMSDLIPKLLPNIRRKALNGKPVFKPTGKKNHDGDDIWVAPNDEPCTFDAAGHPVFIRKAARRAYEVERRRAEDEAARKKAKRKHEFEQFKLYLAEAHATRAEALGGRPGWMSEVLAHQLCDEAKVARLPAPKLVRSRVAKRQSPLATNRVENICPKGSSNGNGSKNQVPVNPESIARRAKKHKLAALRR